MTKTFPHSIKTNRTANKLILAIRIFSAVVIVFDDDDDDDDVDVVVDPFGSTSSISSLDCVANDVPSIIDEMVVVVDIAVQSLIV